jgi:acyl-CoA reductase-like NAD-dependent aldehyde dehydrogenase
MSSWRSAKAARAVRRRDPGGSGAGGGQLLPADDHRGTEQQARVCQEEIFGPVLVAMRFAMKRR